MRPVQAACVAILLTALAAPAPAPSAETVARGQIEAAATLEKAERYGEAIELLSSALAAKALSDADTARALFDRGLAYDGLGNRRAAIADYSAALGRDPALSPALSNRGDAMRRSGHFEEAKRDYWAALKCPTVKREYPYYGLGLVAEHEGNVLAARDYFQLALSANPDFGPAAQHLTLVLSPKTDAGLRRAVNDAPAGTAVAAPVGSQPVFPPAAGRMGTLVQLGAFQSAAVAQGAWEKISAASADVLHGLSPQISPIDIAGKGRLWRLRTAVADQPAAASLCAALTRRQLACVPVRR